MRELCMAILYAVINMLVYQDIYHIYNVNGMSCTDKVPGILPRTLQGIGRQLVSYRHKRRRHVNMHKNIQHFCTFFKAVEGIGNIKS